MASVYPDNNDVRENQTHNPSAQPQPNYGNQVGAYPVPSAAYLQGYYLPPGATDPSTPLDQRAPPYANAPPGQPVYPTYTSSVPTQGAYPSSQAYVNAPPYAEPVAYPGYTPQSYAIPYGAIQPPIDAAYPPQYGASPVSNSAYPIPSPSGGAHPVVVYPMAVAVPGTATGSNPASNVKLHEWRVGLFGCGLHCIPNALMAWCCPCVSLAQIYARLGLTTYRIALVRFTLLLVSGVVVRFVPMGSRSSRYKRYTSVVTSSPMGAATVAQPMAGTVWYAFLFAQQVVLIVAIAFARRRTRHRFKIPGNGCVDGLTSCLCPCCMIAQVATHIGSYTPGSCDFTGPDVLPPFQ